MEMGGIVVDAERSEVIPILASRRKDLRGIVAILRPLRLSSGHGQSDAILVSHTCAVMIGINFQAFNIPSP